MTRAQGIIPNAGGRGGSRWALHHREPGQAIGLAAVIMVAVVGVLAIVVDAGMFLMAHLELQKAADAAAEAAIMELRFDPTNQTVPTWDNAVDMAQTVAQRNLGIANNICTDSQPQIVSPLKANAATGTPLIGIGTYALQDGSGSVYTVTVMIRCQAGYSFGRILELLNMPISATATSAIGSLRTADCPIPFVVPPGPNPPINAENAWGWKAGVPMVLQNGGTTNTVVNGVDVSSTTTVCLQGKTCGATDLYNWLTRNPCVPVTVGNGTLNNNGGNVNQDIGKVLSGFAERMGITDYKNQKEVDCPGGPDPRVAVDPVSGRTVADQNWHLQAYSPCLVAIPVLDQASYDALANTNGNVQTLNVIGFNTFYLSYVAQQTGGGNTSPPCYEQSGTCLAGYYLLPAVNGTIGAFLTDGQPIWRPVR